MSIFSTDRPRTIVDVYIDTLPAAHRASAHAAKDAFAAHGIEVFGTKFSTVGNNGVRPLNLIWRYNGHSCSLWFGDNEQAVPNVELTVAAVDAVCRSWQLM